MNKCVNVVDGCAVSPQCAALHLATELPDGAEIEHGSTLTDARSNQDPTRSRDLTIESVSGQAVRSADTGGRLNQPRHVVVATGHPEILPARRECAGTRQRTPAGGRSDLPDGVAAQLATLSRALAQHATRWRRSGGMYAWRRCCRGGCCHALMACNVAEHCTWKRCGFLSYECARPYGHCHVPGAGVRSLAGIRT